MADEYPVKVCAEIAFDENKNLLWLERYIFSRSHGVGERFVKDSKTYSVVASKVTLGGHGGALVEHVVKEIRK